MNAISQAQSNPHARCGDQCAVILLSGSSGLGDDKLALEPRTEE